MSAFQVEMNISDFVNLGKALSFSPKIASQQTAMALRRIGVSDRDKLEREQLSVNFPKRTRRLKNAFRIASPDAKKIQRPSQLFLREWTNWKAFGVFQSGGVQTSGNGMMLVWINRETKRKYAKKLNQFRREKRTAIIRANGKLLLVADLTSISAKSLKARKGSRTVVLGVLRNRVTQKKRLSFFENFQANRAEHERLLGDAADKTIQITLDNAKKAGASVRRSVLGFARALR